MQKKNRKSKKKHRSYPLIDTFRIIIRTILLKWVCCEGKTYEVIRLNCGGLKALSSFRAYPRLSIPDSVFKLCLEEELWY